MKIIGTAYTTPPEYEHDNEYLRDIIESTINNIIKAGEFEEFLEQYFGEVDYRNKDTLVDFFYDGVAPEDIEEIFSDYEEYIA